MRLIFSKTLMAVLGVHLGLFVATAALAASQNRGDEDRLSLASMTLDRMRENLVPPSVKHDVEFSKEWLDSQPDATGGDQWECLAEALYFEARGETVEGQFAVAEVILNRVKSERFPGSPCAVIKQGTGKKYQCQFTYTCDGLKETIEEQKAYERVSKVARAALDGEVPPLTRGATHYHTTAVKPNWSNVYTKTAAIGTHIFYRHTWRTASN